MPYFVPAWALRTIGMSTMRLPRKMVSTACHQFIPLIDHARGEHVSRDAGRHADPQHGDIFHSPPPAGPGNGRHVAAVVRRAGEVDLELVDTVGGGLGWATVHDWSTWRARVKRSPVNHLQQRRGSTPMCVSQPLLAARKERKPAPGFNAKPHALSSPLAVAAFGHPR